MQQYILFTGHMIDAADRVEARFPADKEFSVKEQIRSHLEIIKAKMNNVVAVAAGACGGDVLFHELCREMKIPSEMYLALPAVDFKKASVSFAGKNWEDRFDILAQKIPVHVMPPVKEHAHVWELANEWMLNTALKNGGQNMALIALWDLKEGDGSGGTQHMVTIARQQDALVEIININLV